MGFAVTCAFAFGGPLAARAAPTVCANGTGPTSGTYGALVVPAGETCLVDGTITVGNVTVEPGGRMFVGSRAASNLTISENLKVGPGAQFTLVGLCFACGGGVRSLTIGANVLADHPSVLDLPHAVVNGNIVVKGLSSGMTMANATVAGNVIVTETTGTLVAIAFSTITGQVLVLNNDESGPTPYLIVEGNNIGGNLICKGNSPDPTNQGYANTVGRETLGQCAGL